jgi:hypothetical protein
MLQVPNAYYLKYFKLLFKKVVNSRKTPAPVKITIIFSYVPVCVSTKCRLKADADLKIY